MNGTRQEQAGNALRPAWEAARRVLGDGRLSVIMPAFNLGAVIAANVRRVHEVLAGQVPFEIVVVDDGSADDTRAQVEAAAPGLPGVRVLHLPRNAGKGEALRRGFDVSTGSHALLLDADLDLPPDQAPRFFEIMEREQADVVIGSKRHPESRLNYPWFRRLFSAVYYTLVKLLLGLPVRDTQTGLKLYRREVLRWVLPRMLVKSFAFDLEMLAIAHLRGFRVSESPVTLDFHGGWGAARPSNVRRIMIDTLAIFYRARLLRYYTSIPDLHPPEPPPLVTVVVALPRPSAWLDECLAGLARQTYRRFEVLLLPDAPSGRAWDANARERPTGPLRPAEKRNIGIREARGSIVAFLDDDAWPAEQWLEQAVPHFGDPAVAAVGGPAATPPSDPYLAVLGGRVYANPLVSGSYRYRYVADRVRDVDDYPTCNLLVRTEVLRELGGFHTEFWPGEDTYLCLEIVKRLGRRIVYDPRVYAYHHRRPLFLPHLRQIGRYALHRGYFARRFPATSRRVGYMLPSLLVLGLAVGAAAAAVCPFCRWLYAAAVTAYAALTFASCAHRQPLAWLACWAGVVLTHLVYGVRFAMGLLAYRMPDAVRPFDHASETPAGGG